MLLDIRCCLSGAKSHHSRACNAYQAATSGTDLVKEEEDSHRRDFRPTPALLNQSLVAYTVLKIPLSAANYETVAGLCKTVGGATCLAQYQDHYFLKEFLTAINTVIWENNVRFVKSCNQIGLYMDVADGFLLIRVTGLDDRHRLKTIFWQARLLSKKKAKDIAVAILHAFTQAPPDVSEEFTLTEPEFLQKLNLCVMDGASENGVRTGSVPIDHAKEGKNVLWYLQSKKEEVAKDKRQILAYWCSSHRVDLATAAPEKTTAWVAVLMTFMRSLVGHIVASTKAQATLKWLSTIIDEDIPHVTKNLASAYYAPQRFVSCAQTLKTMCDRMDEVVLYLLTMTYEDNSKADKAWANSMLHTMDLKFYMVVPGLLDIMMVMDSFNKCTQPRSTRAETVADQLALAQQRIQDLILRTKTEALGLEQATIVKAMYSWLQRKHPAEVPSTSTWFEKTCTGLNCHRA